MKTPTSNAAEIFLAIASRGAAELTDCISTICETDAWGFFPTPNPLPFIPPFAWNEGQRIWCWKKTQGKKPRTNQTLELLILAIFIGTFTTW